MFNNFSRTIQKFLICCTAGSFLLVSIVMAQGTATYDLTFTATWSSTTHPTDFPSGPHFSGMIGGTHNSAVSFWDTGANASEGIKQMAEFGSKGALRTEVNRAISAANANAIVDGSTMNSPGSQTTTFTIRPSWNLVTVTSMLAPSPDWFVGVSGLDLLDSDGEWVNSLVVDLFVYDAGTDSGPDYTSPNQPTNPREPISRISSSPFLVDGSVKPVGTFRFDLKTVVGNTPRVSLSADQNPVDEGESVTVTVQLSSALNTDVAIPLTLSPGTAESGDYDSTTPVSLSITSGATEAQYTIQTYRDSDIEDETFTVGLDTNNLPSGVVAGSPVSEEVTIRDLDATASLSVDQNPVDEGESVTVTVQLSNALNTDVAIPLTLSPGTAESGDYDSTTPVNLNITSGATEAQYTIQTYRDNDIEDETFTVGLDTNNLPSGVMAGSPVSEEVTVRDLDMSEVNLSVDQNPVDEGESVTVTVQLSIALNTDVAIPLKLSPGTAESDDYDSTSPVSLDINSGATEAEYTIQTYRDNDIEDETFTVELDVNNLPSGIGTGSPVSEEVTIKDLDAAASLSVDQNPVDEGESVTVTVQLFNALNTDVAIPLKLSLGTAESGDYDSASPVILDITSGATEAEYTIQTYRDNDIEDETFTVELDVDNLPSGVGAGSPVSEEVTIRDLDAAASLSVDQNPVDEGESVTVTVQLSNALNTDVAIPLALSPGTAESGDYDSASPVSLDINSGATEAAYTIQTYRDNDIEDETFTVELDVNYLPSGVVAGSPASEEVTIRDLDAAASLSVDQNPVDEGESVTVTVQLSNALNTDVAIPLTLSPGTAESGDYDSASPVSLDINSGATQAEYTIQTYRDNDIEDETFTVELDVNNLPSGVGAGSPVSEEVTIRDLDAAASLSVDQNPVDEGESVTVTVQLSNALNTDVAIPLTLSPGTAESGDYDSASPVSLDINSGATQAEYTIQTYRDNDIEDETFTVELDVDNLPSGVGGGSPVSEEVTIRDLDAAASLSVDQNPVDEGESVTVTVQLSNALDTDVAIPLTLSPGTAESGDYDSASPVSLDINSGATQAEYTIQTYRDNDIEDETFTVELDTNNLPSEVVASSPVSEEVTITDLDMPGVSTPTSVEFMEGEMTSINVALTAQPSSDVTVTLTGHENTDLMLDLNVLTFTPSNWDQEQTVTLTAAEDTDLLNDEVTLTLSASGSGYIASHTLTVTIQDNMGVGSDQTEEAVSLVLWGNYPNPLSNSTKIAFNLPAPAQISVAITDILGRTVKMLPYKSFGVGTGHTVQINTGDLPSGVYYYTLKIVMDDKVVRRSKAMSIVR